MGCRCRTLTRRTRRIVGRITDRTQDRYSEPDIRREQMRSSIELPSFRDQFKQEVLPPFQSSRPRELLPSILSHSPPGRSSTLPPIQRREKLQRPRKSSINKDARKIKHERNKSSREFARRLSIEGRKAMSAEPPAAAWAQGKRWEDLIEAATSATEADDDRDLTPVSRLFVYPWQSIEASRRSQRSMSICRR